MEFITREALDADLPAILSLYGQPDMNNGKIMELDMANNVFRKIGNYPNYRLFVASTHDRIIGTYALIILDNLAHMGAPSAIVEDVVVLDECRRQGVGKAMIKHDWVFVVMQIAISSYYPATLSENLPIDSMKLLDSHGMDSALLLI